MNVYYTRGFDGVTEHITTDLIQTNWWVTSFTPRIHYPAAEDIGVEIYASFNTNNSYIHANLIQKFYLMWTDPSNTWDNESIEIASPPLYNLTNPEGHGYQFYIHY